MESTEDPSGGAIWVVLFGLIMGISLLGNLLLLGSLLLRAANPLKTLYKLQGLFFSLNLLSDVLILFEFIAMGTEQTFPIREGLTPCLMYQNALKLGPAVQGALVCLAAYHLFLRDSTIGILLKVLLPLGALLLSFPTTLYTSLREEQSGKWICEMDFEGDPRATSLYHLIFMAVLTYWLPLLLSVYPIVRLIRQVDKCPEASVALSTVASYFVLYLPFAVIVTTRYSLIILDASLTRHQIWVINVSQSLSWLIAYFWHFIRPSLILVLDLDLKGVISDWFCGWRSFKTITYDPVASQSGRHFFRKPPASIHIPPVEENTMLTAI